MGISVGWRPPKQKRVDGLQQHWCCRDKPKGEQTQPQTQEKHDRTRGWAMVAAAPTPWLGHRPPCASSHLGLDFTTRMTIYCPCLGNKRMEMKQRGVVCV